MPNAPVQAAVTGLPTLRPSLREIMLEAHAGARAMPARLPYTDRLNVALRGAWRSNRAAILQCLRELVEARVERLLAFLDALDGDPDLEPSLGYYSADRYELDAEGDTVDDEPSLGALEIGEGDQIEWCQGNVEDLEADELGPMARATYIVTSEAEAAREASLRLDAIITRLSGVPANEARL